LCTLYLTSQMLTDGRGLSRFNIYIYDYCNKRGFRETAQKLMVEADIAPDSAPPINAKQGLLFECVLSYRIRDRGTNGLGRWWSVFWVLFTAKSSGSGTEDAMLYIQQV
jgi:collagen type III alpha